MCRDALIRDESCGCHLREEHQTQDGEPVRDDEHFAHVAVWEYRGRTPSRSGTTSSSSSTSCTRRRRSYL